MYKKSKKRLETIYEIDEIIMEEREKMFAQRCRQQSRLLYYLCCCMAIGCFITLTLIVALSLNSSLLSKTSLNKSSDIESNISVIMTEKFLLTMDIVDHLDVLANEICDNIDDWSNSLTWMISRISTWSSIDDNELLWIYTYLKKYPRSCYANKKCHDDSKKKLQTIFTELSNSLTNEFEFSNGKQIQLDWCHLIENTTTIILVSLISMTTIVETHNHCKNIDPTTLLSKPIDHIIRKNHQQVINDIDIHSDHLNNEENDNLTDFHSTENYLYKSATSCSNNAYTQVLLTWNSF